MWPLSSVLTRVLRNPIQLMVLRHMQQNIIRWRTRKRGGEGYAMNRPS